MRRGRAAEKVREIMRKLKHAQAETVHLSPAENCLPLSARKMQKLYLMRVPAITRTGNRVTREHSREDACNARCRKPIRPAHPMTTFSD